MKVLNGILRVILVLLLVAPILGAFGVFPPPTRDLYNTDKAFNFIMLITQSAFYIANLITIIFAVCIVLILMNRMAVVALLLLPLTVNIIGFHMFLDGGIFTAGAIMANVLALLNAYFLWTNRHRYAPLLSK